MSRLDDQELLKIARETIRWMKKEGAVHDGKEHTRSCIVRDDWFEEFKDRYEIRAEDWPRVCVVMFRLGAYLGLGSHGFFLSDDPQDAATSPSRLMNAAMALMNLAKAMIEAQSETPEWSKLAAGYAGRVHPRELIDVVSLVEAAELKCIKDVELRLLEISDRYQKGYLDGVHSRRRITPRASA